MMIEMFEKVGEINVIALRPAAENRSIAETEKVRKAEEERREDACIANDVLMKLVNAINAEAEEGGEYLHLEWNNSNSIEPFGIDWDDYGKAIKHILPLLKDAGYRVSKCHAYSGSWARKSGKKGYTYIWWN